MQYLSYTIEGNMMNVTVKMDDNSEQVHSTAIIEGLSETDLESTAIAFVANLDANIA